MTSILYVHGPILEGDGHVSRRTSDGHWRSETCTVDDGLADLQPGHIAVHVRHRGPAIGEVVHLEARHDRVFAVAQIDVDLLAESDDLPVDADTARWFWSPSIKPPAGGDRTHIVGATLTELSLTTTPLTVAFDPVRATRQRPHRLADNHMLRRAADTISERSRGRVVSLRINRLDDRGRPLAETPMRLEHSRHAGRVLSVR